MRVGATIRDETSKIYENMKHKTQTGHVLGKNLSQRREEEVVLEEITPWEDKPLHGTDHQTITRVADIKKFYH